MSKRYILWKEHGKKWMIAKNKKEYSDYKVIALIDREKALSLGLFLGNYNIHNEQGFRNLLDAYDEQKSAIVEGILGKRKERLPRSVIYV